MWLSCLRSIHLLKRLSKLEKNLAGHAMTIPMERHRKASALFSARSAMENGTAQPSAIFIQ